MRLQGENRDAIDNLQSCLSKSTPLCVISIEWVIGYRSIIPIGRDQSKNNHLFKYV